MEAEESAAVVLPLHHAVLLMMGWTTNNDATEDARFIYKHPAKPQHHIELVEISRDEVSWTHFVAKVAMFGDCQDYDKEALGLHNLHIYLCSLRTLAELADALAR
jgi:hypothetical protein